MLTWVQAGWFSCSPGPLESICSSPSPSGSWHRREPLRGPPSSSPVGSNRVANGTRTSREGTDGDARSGSGGARTQHKTNAGAAAKTMRERGANIGSRRGPLIGVFFPTQSVSKISHRGRKHSKKTFTKRKIYLYGPYICSNVVLRVATIAEMASFTVGKCSGNLQNNNSRWWWWYR